VLRNCRYAREKDEMLPIFSSSYFFRFSEQFHMGRLNAADFFILILLSVFLAIPYGEIKNCRFFHPHTSFCFSEQLLYEVR
jgi:hypothetical protein